MAKPSRLYQLWGCLLAVAFVAALAYGGLAAAFFAWWGPGFAGAMQARRDPAAVRAAPRVTIYDTVIIVEGGGVTFRRSRWAAARAGIIAGAMVGIIGLLVRRLRRFAGLLAVTVAGITAFLAVWTSPPVHVARGVPGQVVTVPFERGGGRSGTRQTTAWMTGYDIVLGTPERDTRLVRLPYNEAPDAEVWRGIVEEKLRQ